MNKGGLKGYEELGARRNLGLGGTWSWEGLGVERGWRGGEEGDMRCEWWGGGGSLAIEVVYNKCMGWVHAPPPPLAAPPNFL
jgi:hypothetical protein